MWKEYNLESIKWDLEAEKRWYSQTIWSFALILLSFYPLKNGIIIGIFYLPQTPYLPHLDLFRQITYPSEDVPTLEKVLVSSNISFDHWVKQNNVTGSRNVRACWFVIFIETAFRLHQYAIWILFVPPA